MPRQKPDRPIEEIARRGDEWYEKHIRPLVEEGNHGRIVAIDIDTGEYEVDDTTTEACEALYARLPQACIWSVRIGFPYVVKFGMGSWKDA